MTLKHEIKIDKKEYTLNNLATLYQKMGFFSKSEKLLLESKEIKLKVFGKQHPEYAACLSNLAFVS